MPISLSCPECGQKLTAPDKAVGKRLKCPKCSYPLTVPSQAADLNLEAASIFSQESKPVNSPGESAFASGLAEENEQPEASNLRSCPDCEKQVSRRANQCPHCGCPLSSSVPSETTEHLSKETARRLPSFLKSRSRLVLLVGAAAASVMLASAVVAYFVFRPGPERSFKRFVDRTVQKLDPVVKKVDSTKISNVRYEVHKTDSLTSPYMAKLSFDLVDKTHARVIYRFDYAYQEGKWVFKNSERHRIVKEDGSEITTNDVEFPSVAATVVLLEEEIFLIVRNFDN